MMDFGAFKVLHRRQQVEEEETRRLAELNHQWDRAIRGGLQHLADALWPDGRALGSFRPITIVCAIRWSRGLACGG